MHRLVATATAFLLVLHVVLGCCWHHRAWEPTHEPSARAADVSHDCCCEHASTGAPPTRDSGPPANCQHERCTFTAGTTVRGGPAHDVADGDAWMAPVDLSGFGTPDSTGLFRHAESFSPRRPGVPLHLLYGALLI